MNRIVTVKSAISYPEVHFRSMTGEEALSSLFEFQVELLLPTHSLDLKQVLGQQLTLEIAQENLQTRYLNGQVTRCSLVGRETATSRFYVYRATVRPWLWYLTQTTDSKIFQQKSVPEVLREVLSEYGFPFEVRLSGDYRKWEYCVQYQESDFSFVSRLMEHEGIYYWFDHQDGQHTLVISDGIGAHADSPFMPLIPYYGPDRAVLPQEQHISRWEPAEQITPGSFATVDYDFKKPAASLDARRSNPGQHAYGDLEVYEWLGGYTDPDQGEFYSRIRLESLQAQHVQVEGHSNVRSLAPGYLFTLRNHPRMSENQEYLVLGVAYRIEENGYASNPEAESRFELNFFVMPSSVPFRPLRTTPVPRTHGPQTARVVGKSGEQIWTDQFGRVKVQFHWDRYGQKNENSSCWVRVSSPWAGSGFGGVQLPRVNDEVIVDFIGGHPDRPIVIGRVYNGSNMPPWELPANATQSGFLSRSRDGDPSTANALMFEDRPGQERIWLHAEKDLQTEVEADENHNVDGNRTTVIGGDDTLTVHGKRTTTVHQLESETFLEGANRTVTGAVNETVNGDETRTFTGNIIETITGNVDETITGNLTQTTTGDVTRTITGPVVDTTTGTVDETITGNLTQTITGDVTRTITGPIVDTITGDVTETVTGATVSTLNGTLDKTITGAVTVNATASVTINTPSWTVNSGPTSFWQDSFAKGTPMRASVVGLSADAWGARLQGYGLNAQFGAVKLDFFALSNKTFGLKSEFSGSEVKAAAVATKTAGLNLINAIASIFP